MTKEEARNELVLWRNRNSDNDYYHKFVEALTMAIKALEKTDGDLISRQAVLDLAKDLTFEGGCKHRCVDVIKIYELPSAEKTAEWRIVGKTTLHYECPKCGGAGDKWDKFCKHCGADMRKENAE